MTWPIWGYTLPAFGIFIRGMDHKEEWTKWHGLAPNITNLCAPLGLEFCWHPVWLISTAAVHYDPRRLEGIIEQLIDWESPPQLTSTDGVHDSWSLPWIERCEDMKNHQIWSIRRMTFISELVCHQVDVSKSFMPGKNRFKGSPMADITFQSNMAIEHHVKENCPEPW